MPTAKVRLNGQTYAIELTPKIEDFEAYGSGKKVADPELLARLFSYSKAILFLYRWEDKTDLAASIQTSQDFSNALKELYAADAITNFVTQGARSLIVAYGNLLDGANCRPWLKLELPRLPWGRI